MLLAAALPGNASAQTHVLQAQGSVGTASARDDLLVPLAFTGAALGLGARYTYAGGPHRIEAELLLGFALLENRFGQATEQLSHGLAVRYAALLDGAGARELDLGAVLRWHDELTYFETWDDAHGYWLSTLVLGPALRDVRPLLPGVLLDTRAELALFGLAARPPAYRMNKQDALTHADYHVNRIGDGTRVVSIAGVQALRIEALARFRSTGGPAGAGLGLGPFLAFARAADPQPIALLFAGVICNYGWEL